MRAQQIIEAVNHLMNAVGRGIGRIPHT